MKNVFCVNLWFRRKKKKRRRLNAFETTFALYRVMRRRREQGTRTWEKWNGEYVRENLRRLRRRNAWKIGTASSRGKLSKLWCEIVMSFSYNFYFWLLKVSLFFFFSFLLKLHLQNFNAVCVNFFRISKYSFSFSLTIYKVPVSHKFSRNFNNNTNNSSEFQL